MRCAGSSVLVLLLLLLLLLLSLSTLSASAAEENQEALSENAGRKWFLRGRKAMESRGHGDARKDEVMGGKGAKNTGANQEADRTYAEVLHDESNKGSATHHMFQQGASGRRSHDDDATITASDMLRVDYSVNPADVHGRPPINNDAPLDDLAEKKP